MILVRDGSNLVAISVLAVPKPNTLDRDLKRVHSTNLVVILEYYLSDSITTSYFPANFYNS